MKALLTRIRDGLSETPRGVIAAVIYYMVLIVSCAVQSAIMDRDLFAYDISMLRAIVCMSVSVRAVWLLVTRAQSARWFCVFGTKGKIISPVEFNQCGEIPYTIERDGVQETKTVTAPNNYALETEQLSRCILYGEKPHVSKAFSLMAAQTTDRILNAIGY